MKVAIVYDLSHPGGVQSCSLSLIKGLNRRGLIPEILWDSEPDWKMLEEAGAKATFRRIPFAIPSRKILLLPHSLRRLAWTANAIDSAPYRQDYGFFYIFYNGFLTANGTPHLRYLSGPPLLPQLEIIPAGPRGIPARVVDSIYRRWLARSRPVFEYHPGSRYVINSGFTARLFEEAHQVRLPVVYPPMQIPPCDFQAEDLSRRDTLTFFSRINPKKRPEMVLELAKRYPELRCLIMGAVSPNRQAYFRQLQRRAREEKLSNVVFSPSLPLSAVRTELARTRFYIFPAVDEHFGITTVEAIAAGAVPFVHDSGGQREIVPDPRLRFTDATFMSGFEKLLKLPAAELNSIRQSLARRLQNFSEEAYIEKMLAYLDA